MLTINTNKMEPYCLPCEAHRQVQLHHERNIVWNRKLQKTGGNKRKKKKKRKEKDNCNQYIHPRGKRLKKESTAGGNFYFYFNQHCKTCRNAENTNKCVKLDV